MHHAAACTKIVKQFSVIIETLEVLQHDRDTKTSSTTTSLCRSLLCFEFVFCLTVTEHLLQHLVPLCDFLQMKNCDLIKASNHAKLVVDSLQGKRNSPQAFDQIYDAALFMADSNDISISRPRTSARMVHRTNKEAPSVKEWWRLNVFI